MEGNQFKGTKGKFSDGHEGWKVGKRNTNGVDGFEIHWSDDGECVTDHVYNIEDANLISCAPEMIEVLQIMLGDIDKYPKPLTIQEKLALARKVVEKALS